MAHTMTRTDGKQPRKPDGTGDGEPRLPFAVSRSKRATLVEQVADGLRTCILSGVYRPGDVLPTTRGLADELGVSRIVTRAAVRRLAADGLVNPKPSVGSVVLGPGGRLWRGNVLFVQRTDGRTFYDSVFTAVLRARLVKAGWLFTQVTASPLPGGSADLAELEVHLASPVSLAIAMFDNPGAERALSRAGVPFLTLGDKSSCRLRGCVGHVRYDRSAAAGRFVAAAKRAGVRSVLEVGMDDRDDIGAALAAAGVRASRWTVAVPDRANMPVSVAFAARDAFAARLAKSRAWLPDLLYFSDDYVCAGALTAFSAAGVRVPENVRVATWSNRGNGPVFARALARMEMDPEGDAVKVADALLARLGGDPRPIAFDLAPVFVPGETM